MAAKKIKQPVVSKGTEFHALLQNFNEGNAPLAHLDTKTFIGNAGQASESKCDLVTKPGFLTQGPGFTVVTNGDQTGSVSELINFILDTPTSTNVTFAVGNTKLFKLTNTGVSNTSPYPQTISGMTGGESVIELQGNLYIFYNTSGAGDIAKMPLSTDVIDATWGSVTVSGGVALQKALHPSATKEDIIVFGNGRYAGVYIEGLGTLDAEKLDFGEEAEVVDVVFNANVWWIAVNRGSGNRVIGEVYSYDGSATSSILTDEAGVGIQKIGFLYVINAQVYVCYEELSSGAYTIGYIVTRQIKPLAYFSGTLPTFKQKTLYYNTILFVSNNEIWTTGAVVTQLPIQSSKLSSGGLGTIGAIAAPFGIPLVASTDGGSNFQLAQFSGYSTDSNWKSVYMDTSVQRYLAKITYLIITTKSLVGNARADITLEGNQSSKTSSAFTVQTAGKTRHLFRNIDLPRLQDLRVVVDYTNGDTTNDCPIRKIELGGVYVEE